MKRFYFKSISLVFCILLLLSLTVSCGSKEKNGTDILSQKPTDKERTQITVLIKHAFTINGFEEAVEKKFPDIDIVQVGNFTTALAPDEMEARMKNDDLTDIIMTWPRSFGQEYCEERLLDLSVLPITNKYNISMLDEISQDGKLYYIPGPSQVRGIVYNKTLFEEKGWSVPTDYEEFLALCQKIEESGIRSIQLGFKNPEVLDTAFIGYGYSACFSKPKDTQWIANYSQGEGTFTDHFDEALSTFQQMKEKGIWREEDLDIDYSVREQMFFSRQAAMIEDSALMTRAEKERAGSTDEFALMPFFNPGGDGNDWVRLYMVCYIGLNKHLADEENEAKYDKVTKLMEYISTPKGQDALSSDTGLMYSSLKESDFPSVPEAEHIVDALDHGRYAIFKELDNVQPTLRQGLASMLRGELTKEQVGEMVDAANTRAVGSEEKTEVLGSATADFTLIETGNFITDVMKKQSGADIALFLDGGKDGRYNNKGVTAKLYEGDISEKDIIRIMPDYQLGDTGEMWIASVNGEDLIQILEYAKQTNDGSEGWFYYFSGLEMKFNATNKPGERIKSITLADGSQIEDRKKYKIAIMENSVAEEYLKSYEKTGYNISDLLKSEVKSRKSISPSEDGRFKVVQ